MGKSYCMKLIDLDPYWVVANSCSNIVVDSDTVPDREGVGVNFDCPCGCGDRCYIPFSNPVDGKGPIVSKHDQWRRTGETFETLTVRPSIQRTVGCKWHGFLTDGELKSV